MTLEIYGPLRSITGDCSLVSLRRAKQHGNLNPAISGVHQATNREITGMIEFIETANEQNPESAPISVDHLREHARTVARSWGVTRQAGGVRSWLASNPRDLLDSSTGESTTAMPRLDQHWAATRFDAARKSAFCAPCSRQLLCERKINRLPQIVVRGAQASPTAKVQQEMPRAAAVAAAFFSATQLVWHPDAFKVYVDELQVNDRFDLLEFWALPTFLKFHLLGEILDSGADAPGWLQSRRRVRNTCSQSIFRRFAKPVLRTGPLYSSRSSFSKRSYARIRRTPMQRWISKRGVLPATGSQVCSRVRRGRSQVAVAALELAREARDSRTSTFASNCAGAISAITLSTRDFHSSLAASTTGQH